jgi:hypothetical protein
MRKSAMLFMLLGLGSMAAFAESFQGRLVDATCYDQQKSATACDPTGSTTMFTLLIADKPYKLDDAGNAKAVDALKNRADRSTDPNAKPAAQVVAKITGTKDGDNILKVEAVEVQ